MWSVRHLKTIPREFRMLYARRAFNSFENKRIQELYNGVTSAVGYAVRAEGELDAFWNYV